MAASRLFAISHCGHPRVRHGYPRSDRRFAALTCQGGTCRQLGLATSQICFQPECNDSRALTANGLEKLQSSCLHYTACMATVAHPITPEVLLGPLNDVERHNAPDRLFFAGDPSLLKLRVRVAVVGTRRPSPEGHARARRVASLLVRNDVVVASGLARGVDTAAHSTAIAAGGRTIAVLGTPLDRVYPAENRGLLEQITRDHLAISQFTSGTDTQRFHFILRNRLMALITHGTVIVEAGERSGTQSQAWEALRLGRQLFVMRSLAERNLSWVNKVIEYGAHVLADEQDLIERLPLDADLDSVVAF